MTAHTPSSVLPVAPADVIAFGPFRLSLGERRLESDGNPVRLGGRALDILVTLASQPGRVVTKAELTQAAWPGLIVEEANLRFHIGVLRKALEEEWPGEAVITTVAGRGYCFTAPVTRPDASPGADGSFNLGRVNEGSIVGRAAPRQALVDRLDRAMAHEAQVVFLTGEAGIGKSALAGAFVEDAEGAGATVVIGRCLPGNADTDPYYPILDILTQLSHVGGSDGFAALAARIAPTWAVQLPIAAQPIAMGGGQDVFGATPYRMTRELSALLDALAREHALVLILEDIQWADQTTLDVLRAIADHRLKARLLILATLRAPNSQQGSKAGLMLSQWLVLYQLATEISLSPLTEEDVGHYLTRRSGGPSAPDLTKTLHARSGGNPLFMRAMLEHWGLQGQIVRTAEGWAFTPGGHGPEANAPPTIARIVEHEIERLSPDHQAVVYAASLTEGSFIPAVSHAATGLDEDVFEAICEDLVRADSLIRRAETVTLPDRRRVQAYAFRHMVFRDVAYQRQGPGRRSAMHGALAARLAAIYASDLGPVATTLARHYTAAQNWMEAVRFVRLGARTARRRFAHREAAAALEQALAVAANLGETVRGDIELDIREELAAVYTAALDPRASALSAELVSSAAQIGRTDIQCRALLVQGVSWGWSDLDRSIPCFRQAIALSRELPDHAEAARIRSEAHGWCSWAAGWSQADADACAAAVSELVSIGDPVALAAGRVNRVRILFSSSRYREAFDTLVSSFEILAANASKGRADLGMPYWHFRLGMPWCLLYAGELGRSLELFRLGVGALLGNGDLGRAATLQFYEALGHVHIQDFTAAAALCQSAVEYTTKGADAPRLTPNEGQMEYAVRGLAALGQGQPAAAMAWFARATEQGDKRRTVSSWHWGMLTAWGMTDACLASGQMEPARRHGAELLELSLATQERTWRALARETAARLALADRDWPRVASHLDAAWAQTAPGELPLVQWRLYAVAAALHARQGDDAAAGLARQARTEALDALIQTLPEGHKGRETLRDAQPILPA